MRWMALVFVAVFAAGCAGGSPRDEDYRRQLDAKRELERDCRMAARMRQRDPRCPQPDYEQPQGPERLQLPDPPAPISPPRG